MTQSRFRSGDLVQVRPPEEILQTLDADGTLGQLPFMPEMLEFCGRSFHVARRAEMTCASQMESPRGFKINDVVTLDCVRCSGAAHDGCQKACMIFWREAWLRKVENAATQFNENVPGTERLRACLKVSTAPNIYFCQASELEKITYSLSRLDRIAKYFSAWRARNFSAQQMVLDTWTWLFWKIRRVFLGTHVRGSKTVSPAESLNLQPGDLVEVKSINDIVTTLNERGTNRGLAFFPGMHLFCGRRYRVKGRLDKLIVDGTGEMRKLKNTVLLERATCRCSYLGFGVGCCSRDEFAYWREIWLHSLDHSANRSRPGTS
jgi:hypothetical protein